MIGAARYVVAAIGKNQGIKVQRSIGNFYGVR